MRQDLIDEYRICVHPIQIGEEQSSVASPILISPGAVLDSAALLLLLMYRAQRTEGREVSRAQRLNPGFVIASEWRHRTWAAGRHRGRCGAEPDSDVEGVHGTRRRVRVRIGEWRGVVDDWRGGGPRGDDERLDVEAADEVPYRPADGVRLHVSLVPGQAEGGIGDLDHEDVELGVRWQADGFDVHDFYRAERVDRRVRQGGGNAVAGSGAGRPHHGE